VVWAGQSYSLSLEPHKTLLLRARGKRKRALSLLTCEDTLLLKHLLWLPSALQTFSFFFFFFFFWLCLRYVEVPQARDGTQAKAATQAAAVMMLE